MIANFLGAHFVSPVGLVGAVRGRERINHRESDTEIGGRLVVLVGYGSPRSAPDDSNEVSRQRMRSILVALRS
jgi:hypothetical protein